MTTPASSPLKVLVTGSATTSLKAFFAKLTTMQTKHSFSLCLALDLFSGMDNESLELAELLAGKIEVPLQVYVGTGGGILPDKVLDKVRRGEEVCTNVMVLGKAGLLTLASGLKIATFGGSYDAELFAPVPAEDEVPVVEDPLDVSHFTSSDLTTFLNRMSPPPSAASLPAPPISPPDILLTHCFPPAVMHLSAKPLPAGATTVCDAAPLDEVVRASRAKYVFCSGKQAFWEREPFTWPRENGAGVCRFISLGEMGNTAKERWFYAFSITPNLAITIPPANSTASPFSAGGKSTKRSASEMDAGVNEYGVPNYIFGDKGKKGRNGNGAGGERGPPPDHYTCKICDQKGHWIQECPEKVERDRTRFAERGDIRKPIQPDECWFCLSNPKLTKHLITSIGTETYMTLPKGQLPPTSAEAREGNSPVPGGGHVLIIPIAHYPTLLSVPSELAVPIVSEIQRYKSALRDCYDSFGASMVSFEVGRLSGKGGHAHIQIVPVPKAMADKVEECFRTQGEQTGIEFEADGAAALKAASGVTDNYFRVDLPDGKVLVHLIQPGKPFNLQFGRATLATLLGIPQRTDWKACTKSDADEKADASRFKAAFKAFDPSL